MMGISTGSYENPKERSETELRHQEAFPEEAALVRAEGWVGTARQRWGWERRQGKVVGNKIAYTEGLRDAREHGIFEALMWPMH